MENVDIGCVQGNVYGLFLSAVKDLWTETKVLGVWKSTSAWVFISNNFLGAGASHS